MVIRTIIEMIQSEKWYNVSEEMEIAKGKYQYIDTITKARRRIKRIRKSKQA